MLVGLSVWQTKARIQTYPSSLVGIHFVSLCKAINSKYSSLVTYAKQPHLDAKYTIFGKVIDGMDTLDALEMVPVDEKSRPLQDIRIKNVIIHANPLAE